MLDDDIVVDAEIRVVVVFVLSGNGDHPSIGHLNSGRTDTVEAPIGTSPSIVGFQAN